MSARWYCFVTPRGIYIGKVLTTEAEIRVALCCNIEGNTVTVLGAVEHANERRRMKW